MNKTKISYLDFTWNPLAMRCTPVSPGCAHCWHLAMADRLANNPRISHEARMSYAGKAEPLLMEERLTAPLRRKKPAVIGVQFMGDLFHDDIEWASIAEVWDVIAAATHHKFLVLTKRPQRMLDFLMDFWLQSQYYQGSILPNAWLGITVENQATADERIPLLLQTPAAVRFVSCEPLLGPVDLWPYLDPQYFEPIYYSKPNPTLSWVIVGGETSSGARPMRPQWARDIRDQCQAAGIPYFHKQNGVWTTEGVAEQWSGYGKPPDNVRFVASGKPGLPPGVWMHRVTKKAADHLLDGQEWRQWPGMPDAV